MFYDPHNSGQSPIVAELLGLLALLFYLAIERAPDDAGADHGNSFEWLAGRHRPVFSANGRLALAALGRHALLDRRDAGAARSSPRCWS
jgi:hypothetical protein